MSINDLIQEFLKLKRHLFVSPTSFSRTPESAPTEDYQVANKKYVDDNAGGGSSYLVYTALLTQSGTSAPVATVLENTLGGTVIWSRNGVGNYIATLVGAFTEAKTFVSVSNGSINDAGFQVSAYRVSSDTCELDSFTFDFSFVDLHQSDCAFEIRVYS